MKGVRAYHYAATATAPVKQPFVARDLLSVRDFSPQEIEWLFELTRIVKKRPAEFRQALAGKQQVLFFEKASLRTRLTFESAMAGLGGASIFVDQTQSRLDERESLSDIARNVERWADAVVLHERDTNLNLIRSLRWKSPWAWS